MNESLNAERLRQLLTLLDDPSPEAGTGVLAEILRYGDAVLPFLAEYQEADDPVLRKRVHQLESILTVRRRRKEFLANLKAGPADLTQGLIDVHLLWFDNDSRPALEEMFQSFLEVAANNPIRDIEDLAKFMLRSGFCVPSAGELADPENYCIGTILEERVGSDILLCVLALLVGAEAGLELGLVRVMGRFAVMNVAGVMIVPGNNWQSERAGKLRKGDFWNDPRAVLKYASLMLFLYAVSSDSFRYVHTIGHSLVGLDDHMEMDFLPYPYGGKEPEGSSQK